MRWWAILLAVGCARVSVMAVDYRAQTFTLCGNRWADRADLERSAASSCSTSASALACESRAIGAVASTVYGQYASTTVARPTYGLCCAYLCPASDGDHAGK